MGDRLFELCCIPFRVYGLALQDVVRTTPDGTLLSEIVRPSGRRVLRVLLALGREGGRTADAGQRIESVATAAGLLYEWSGDRHIAIDVQPEANSAELINVILAEERDDGAR